MNINERASLYFGDGLPEMATQWLDFADHVMLEGVRLGLEAAGEFVDWHALCQTGKIIKINVKANPAMGNAIRALDPQAIINQNNESK